MKQVVFTVPGEPSGKGRPRFSGYTGANGKTYARAYTPNKTVMYENLVKLESELNFDWIASNEKTGWLFPMLKKEGK